MKKISVLLLISMMSGCGKGDKEESISGTLAGLNIHIEFPKNIEISKLEQFKKEVELYRVTFSGENLQPKTYEVERKRFNQFTFSDVPFHPRLYIQIEALSLNRLVHYCSGEMIASYISNKKGEVIIPLRCP